MLTSTFSSLCLLLLISIQSTLTQECYECRNCIDVASCKCDHLVPIDTRESYCVLIKENLPDGGVSINIQHVPRNSTLFYVYNPYYISVSETISYNEATASWLSESKKITYACQTDKCNRDDLLRQFPETGLSLSLPTQWLNENLQRKPNKNMTSCHDCVVEMVCSDTEYFINTSQCNVKECQGSCLINDIFSEAETSKFCYQSFCSDDTSIGPELSLPKISIDAIYYISNERFEVTQIDVFCNAEDCSQLKLLKDVKEQLKKDLNGIKPFLPANSAHSIYSTSFLVLIIIFFQISIFL